MVYRSVFVVLIAFAVFAATALTGCDRKPTRYDTQTALIRAKVTASQKGMPRDTVDTAGLKRDVGSAVKKMAAEGYRIVSIVPLTGGQWAWRTHKGVPKKELPGNWGWGWGMGMGVTIGVMIVGQRELPSK